MAWLQLLVIFGGIALLVAQWEKYRQATETRLAFLESNLGSMKERLTALEAAFNKGLFK